MKLIKHKFLSGPNIFSYTPVIEAEIDIDGYDQVESCSIPGFNDKLLSLFPGLAEHHCSTGEKGGFILRLKEGTYLGHIIEHLTLQIQHCLGHKVYYGKTIWKEKSIYKLIIEYRIKELGLFALKQSITVITKIIAGNTVDKEKLTKEGEELNRRYGIGPSTEAILKEANLRDIPWLELNSYNSLYQLGYGKNQKRIEATIASTTSSIGVDIAADKILTKNLLAEVGLPVPRGIQCSTLEELKDLVLELEMPLVVKPYNGNHGKGVTVSVYNWYDLKKAFYRARKFSKEVLVEEYISGKDYRILVINNKVVAAAERKPAHIEGNGIDSIKELIIKTNMEPDRGSGHEKPLTRIVINKTVESHLLEQGYTLESIPEEGQVIFLRNNGNLSTGGTAKDVTAEVHPVNADLALRAARTLGLDIAGIDIITPDIRVPIIDGSGAIIEVNAAPGIRMHLHPSEGQQKNVAKDIIDYLFPAGSGRIPIVAITGTNGKTTTTRLLGDILQARYEKVGMTTTSGIYINSHCIMEGDNTGPRSARTLLMDPTIEVALLETARGGIVREGLGYRESDIGVIINITEDHLGVDGINTIDDLANIKSLVIETVKEDGYSILNADDPVVVKLSKWSSAPIIFFSARGNNLVIKRHCEEGGRAVYIDHNRIIHQITDKKEIILEGVDKIPITFNGLATHNLQNVLTATAVSLALQVNKKDITRSLLRFGYRWNDNLGRLNLFKTIGLTVILDYGHNPAGFEEVFKFMHRLSGERLVGIIGVPGDRKDDWIIRTGKIAGQFLDKVYIKEDYDLRGRQSGEVATLIKEGLKKAGFQGQSQYIAAEKEALRSALYDAGQGDIIVCFYEKDPEELTRIIRQGIIEFETKRTLFEPILAENLIID